jgi:hypothetical protein
MKIGKIITEIEKEFTIGNLKMYRMNKKNA